MAETEVAVRFTSKEEAQLFQAFVKLTQGFAKTTDGAEKTKKATDGVDASLRRFAASVKAAQSTPDSRHADEMAKLKAALDATLLTQEQFAAASAAANAKYQAEINKSTLEAQEFAKAQRAEEVNAQLRQQIALVRERGAELEKSRQVAEAAAEQERRDLERVEGEWDRYAAGVKEAIRTPIQTYHAKLEKLSEAHLRGKLTLDEYHAAAKKAFASYRQGADGAAKSQESLGVGTIALGSMLAQTWTSAISLVGRASSAMQAEHQRALAAQQGAGRTLGSLAQIAGTPEEMASLSGMARGLVRTGAAPDMASAVNTIFDAKSANAIGDLGELRKLAEPGVIANLSEVIKSAESLRKAMGGEATGSVTDLVGKAFAAAGPSTASAEGILIGAARAGTQSKAGGVSVDELLAGTGVIATARGSADEGGTRMAALLRGMESDASLNGKTLVDRIRTIQQRNMTPEALTKELTAEGADAFRILANNLGELEATAKASAAQVTAETIAKKQSIALSEKAVHVDMLARQAKASGDLLRETEGRVVALTEAAVDQGVTERRMGARRNGLLSAQNIPFMRHVMPDSLTSELDAMLFGGAAGAFGTMPGSKLPEAIAGSDRTDPAIRKAMADALASQAEERKQFVATMQQASESLARSAAALERSATRVDRTGQARREAAVAAGGN